MIGLQFVYYLLIMWEQEKEDRLKGELYQGYQVLEVLGCGTFGKVYKIKQLKSGQIFAMKHVLQNKKYKNRQLQILQLIKSPYVVQLHHHFLVEQKDGLFLNLVMQYMPEPLSKILKSNYPYKRYLPPPILLSYTKCLLTALKDMHALNICHRDIKPSNILIHELTAKLCDFGSAKVLNNTQKNIAYICSRYYRAPELLLGATYYTYHVDIWSLGCVIAEMMTNHSLFQGTNSTAMLSKIIKCLGPPSPQDLTNMNIEDTDLKITAVEGTGLRSRLTKLNPECPEELIGLVEQMVVYDPLKRIPAADALKLPFLL